MKSFGDADATTRVAAHDPSLDAPAPLEWFVTIAWHPDTSRIGATFRQSAVGQSLVLGRAAPLFTDPDGCHAGLADGHVSRRAMCLRPATDGWRLEREPGACHLRIDGRDVDRCTLLTDDAVRKGFSVALGHTVLLHLRLRAEAAAQPGGGAGLEALLGVGAAMGRLRDEIRQAACSGDDVLLVGPTGTGKELVARALHTLGSGPAAPWVAVNMAAIPAEIAAASLFGARRGAFTGAIADQPGHFQRAAGGTLFLDEVGDTPPALQPLLLRALQEREIQVLGGTPQRVELRVVAAMERDPDDPGLGFRRALRHRLGAQELWLPPLAERAEDIGLLAARFLEERARRAGQTWFSAGVPESEQPRWLRLFELLLAWRWPGNVRELRHAIAQAAPAGDVRPCPPAQLLRRLQGAAEAGAGLEGPDTTRIAEAPATPDDDRPTRLADLDDEAFLQAWKSAGFEVAAMARQQGVSRAAVYRRLRGLRRCRLAGDVPLAELLAALDACRGDLAATAERLAVSRRGLQARLRASGVRSAGVQGGS